MIYKNIHFIWINRTGTPLPSMCEEFIAQWREMYPGHNVRVWGNEDLLACGDAATLAAWADDAFDEACVSNRFRLFIVAKHGGIYADVDTKPIKNMSELLGEGDMFLAGRREFSSKGGPSIVTNLFYAPKNCPVLLKTLIGVPICVSGYRINEFIIQNFSDEIVVCPSPYFHSRSLTEECYTLHWPHRLGTWIRAKKFSTRNPK